MNPEEMPLHIEESDLHEYFDGRGVPSWRAGIDTHLAACASCQSRLSTLTLLAARIESLPEVELETDLSLGVMRSLRPARKSWAAGAWLLAGQAGIALVLIFLSRSLIGGLVDLGQGWFTLDSGLVSRWAEGMATNFMSNLSEIPNTLSTAANAFLSQIPTAPAGSVLWVIAAAAAVLWFAVHARLLRQGQDRGDRG